MNRFDRWIGYSGNVVNSAAKLGWIDRFLASRLGCLTATLLCWVLGIAFLGYFLVRIRLDEWLRPTSIRAVIRAQNKMSMPSQE